MKYNDDYYYHWMTSDLALKQIHVMNYDVAAAAVVVVVAAAAAGVVVVGAVVVTVVEVVDVAYDLINWIF